MSTTEYKQCKRCVMDTTTRLISFDDKGVCNFCREYDKIAAKTVLRDKEVRYKLFQQDIDFIKQDGKGKPNDCILGLSGGMDSSYMALICKDYGLRPLVVHFDNGWNSELAVKNIENIVNKMGFELYTYVINWEEFKDIQLSYFKASVVDIEVPTDQLIFAAIYKIAKEKKIKYILSGSNVRTESIMPADWCFYGKLDATNLENIHKKYGKLKLNNLPRLGANTKAVYENIFGIQTITFFDKLDFDYKHVRERLVKEVDYVPYQYKHYESVFTRFYQGYILPKKFNIDKRKAHLSSLICSNQITREEALKELVNPTYPLDQQLADKEYILKKWEMPENEFEKIMKQPRVEHEAFGHDKINLWSKIIYRLNLIYLYKIAYPLGLRRKPING